MTPTPKVSIIIPVKPGGVVSAVERLGAAEYPSDALEVFVAEGCCPSLQRNKAVDEASGEIVYFLDDDSHVQPGFLRRAAGHFMESRVAAAGGPSLTPETDSHFQHAIGMAFTSIVGGGGMRNRYRTVGSARVTSDRELILCNLGFRRDVFVTYGGFDSRLYPNEENELMDRIREGGGLLIHDPDLAVTRSQRPTLGAFCRQMFGYGRGRGEQTVVSGHVKLITFLPTLFLCYLLLLPLFHMPVYYLPLLCYLLIMLCVGGYHVVTSGRPLAAALLPAVIPVSHFCYGFGMVVGLAAPRYKRRVAGTTRDITVRRVKEFGGEWHIEPKCRTSHS